MKAKYVLYCAALVPLGAHAYAQNPNAIFQQSSLSSDIMMASKGNMDANTRLGYRYMVGFTGAIDPVSAYNYFTAIAPQSLAATAWLGYAAVTKPQLASKNLNGLPLVLQAANAGDPVGMTLLGRLYQLGKGVPQNTTTAQQLFAKAAPSFALASSFLGETYLQSSSTADHSKAVPYFLTGAAAGDTLSMVQLAAMYTRGDGVAQNLSNAAQWLQQAAQRGDLVAAYQRGLLYYRGQGLPQSHIEAVALYSRAALGGYAPAQAALGMCYATGDGVTKNIGQAIYWLSLAAPTDTYAATELALLKSGKPIN
jgi:TPR repeat protein